MQIQLRFHGIVADLVRPKIESFELTDGATVGEVINLLGRQSKRTVAVLRQTNVFVDSHQANRAAFLTNGVTVSFM